MPTFDHLALRTERLLLRPFREHDAPGILTIRSDPRVMRYTGNPPWTVIEKAHALIADDTKAMASGERLRLGIERTEDSALIGSCILFHLNQQCRRAEIGYELRHDAWGRGYMHEALLALLQFGFTGMALNRVEADIDPRNEPSAKTLERLGFTKEGHLRERWIADGEVSDTGFYGLLLSDWQARQAEATNGNAASP